MPTAISRFRVRYLLPAALSVALTAGADVAPANACGTQNYYGHVCFVTYTAGCPTGYTEADGRLINISPSSSEDVTKLFSLIGFTYGGNGQSTFALPDLRGRTPVSTGTANNINFTLTQKLGQESVTLTMQNLPAHTHTLNTLNAHAPLQGSSNYLVGRSNSPQSNTIASNAISNHPFQSQSLDELQEKGLLGQTAITQVTLTSNSAVSIQTNNANPAQPVSTVPPQVTLLGCIATSNAAFPSRN